MTGDDLSDRLKLQLAVKSVEQLNIFGTWEPLSWASFRVMGQNFGKIGYSPILEDEHNTNQYVIELLGILRSFKIPNVSDSDSWNIPNEPVRPELCSQRRWYLKFDLRFAQDDIASQLNSECCFEAWQC